MAGLNDSNDHVKGVDNPGFSKDNNGESGRPRQSLKARLSNLVIEEKKVSLTPSGKSSSRRSKVEEEKDENVDLSCGIWKFRTNAFGSKFSNLYTFSVFVGLSSFFTMMVQSVLHIQLTSIERQFNINNARAGLFDTASRIGSMCTILFAGHFAKRVNIPFVVGFAGIIQGIALMVPAFIQFADPYTLPLLTSSSRDNSTNSTNKGDNARYLCEFNGNVSRNDNTTKEETNQLAFGIIIMVQVVKGVTDAFHSGFLPALYMDDNMLDKTKMGIFFGINSVLSELSQPIGKQINGILTEVPVDLKDTEMDPKDSRFVAAWWMAFLIYGAGTVVFSIPVMLFPRKLVSKRQQEEALQKAMVSFSAGGVGMDKPGPDKEAADSDRKLSTVSSNENNPARSASQYGKRKLTPLNSAASGVSETLVRIAIRRSSLLPPVDGPKERRISIDGSFVFEQPVKQKEKNEKGEDKNSSSKFFELLKDFPRACVRVFSKPVFFLILLDIAIVSVPMAGTSIFRSAYINNEYNVTMSEVATLTGVTTAVAQIIGTLLSSFLSNKVKSKLGYVWLIMGTHIASMSLTPLYIIFGCGNEVVYGHEGAFGHPLNMTDDCACRGTKNLLSCGEDLKNYLSPCYAGCKDVAGKTFTMCSPLDAFNMTQTMKVTPGLCATDCHANFLIYVIFHAVQSAMFSMGTIPRRLLILRLVDPRDRGFATSIFGFFFTLMALPSPNLFGKIIDGMCIIQNGNDCALYDRDKIRYLMSGIDIGVAVAIQITQIFIVMIFRNEEKGTKKKLEQAEEEEEEKARKDVEAAAENTTAKL